MKVGIVGVGQSSFTRSCKVNIRELCFGAFEEAVKDTNISVNEIDGSIIASAPEYDKQRSPAALISEYFGLTPKPTFMVESLCSSATTGVILSYSMIKSGLLKTIAIVGFQKMSELNSHEVQERMGRGCDLMWEAPFGTTMPSNYALYATRHMHQYGTTEEQLAKIRVKSSKYGTMNPKAMFRKEYSVEDVLKSRIIARPLKMLDCCGNADGASCVIMAAEDAAKKMTDTPVWIAGVGSGTGTMFIGKRESFSCLDASIAAAKSAYKQAKVEPNDIDVAEVHDCFTIAELMAYENLGFCKEGEGGKLIEERETYHGGRIPVNLDGGLLAKGHPIGATGGSQVRTIVHQLRGEAGKLQVEDCETGLVHNVGGVGLYANVLILER